MKFRAKLAQEEDRFRQIEVENNTLEAALEKERKANLDKEKALSERQRDLNQLVGSIRGMENDRKMLEQKQQFLEENAGKLKRDVEKAQHKVVELGEDIEHYRSELNVEKRLEADYEKELDDAEEKQTMIKQSHGELRAGLDEVVKKQQQLERKVFELEKHKAINSNQVEGLEQDLKRSKDSVEHRKGEVVGLNDKMNVIEAEVSQKTNAIEAMEKEEEDRQKTIVGNRIQPRSTK